MAACTATPDTSTRWWRWRGVSGVKRLFVHAITDGRDTSPTGGVGYIGALERTLSAAGLGRIASIGGRYYAMDRDRRWNRTKRAYDAIVSGAGAAIASPRAWLQTVLRGRRHRRVHRAGGGRRRTARRSGPVRSGDSVICFNFRADRVRQITRAIARADFAEFERAGAPAVSYSCLTQYDATLDLPVAFAPQSFSGSLAEVLQAHSVTNLRLAETEKYAHVTYFFNCGIEAPYRGEDRVLIPSPHVATYDLQPEMSSRQITERLLADIASREHGLVICNFANADMVGHTGKLDAAIAAVEALDGCLARIATAHGRVAAAPSCSRPTTGTANRCGTTCSAHRTRRTRRIRCRSSSPDPASIRRCDRAAPSATWPRRILGLMGLPLSAEMTGRDLAGAAVTGRAGGCLSLRCRELAAGVPRPTRRFPCATTRRS